MEFAWGWAGGIAGVLVSHPLDTLRTRQAVSGRLLLAAGTSLKLPRGSGPQASTRVYVRLIID